MIKKKDVLLINTTDSDFEPGIEQLIFVSQDLTLEVMESNGHAEWTFRKVTGHTEDGRPIIDLGTSLNFYMAVQLGLYEIDLSWVMNASLMDVVTANLKGPNN